MQQLASLFDVSRASRCEGYVPNPFLPALQAPASAFLHVRACGQEQAGLGWHCRSV